MKKIVIILIIALTVFKIWLWRLKSSFNFKVISVDAIDNFDIENNQATIKFTMLVKNKHVPDFVINEVFLHVYINNNYLGVFRSNKIITVTNGQTKLQGSFFTNDLGLTSAILLENKKNVFVSGYLKIKKPVPIKLDIKENFVL